MDSLTNKQKRRGAPVLPPEVKNTSRLILYLTDVEKDNIQQYARLRGIKMASLYRRAIYPFLDSCRELQIGQEEERPGTGSNKVFVHVTPMYEEKFCELAFKNHIEAARLLRHIIKEYIERNPVV